ncbi:MAG: hypothetical protein MUP64_04155 [Anaerolineae bacterium]|nr:hypothetical protein [Anaerolineae bacterium]
MLFSLPENTISGVIGYAFNFFDSIKIYIFLAMGVGLGLLILGIIYEFFFSYGAEVRGTARRRLAEEDDDDFEEDVEAEMAEILLE